VKTKDLNAGAHLPLLSEGVDVLTEGQWGNEDLGFLVGWNIGDGWRTERSDNGKTQLGFIVSDKDRLSGIDERIESILEGLGSRATFGEGGELNVITTSVVSIFEEAGYKGKHVGLPIVVWKEASEEFRRGLIDGLFSSDGCFGDGVSMSTAHEALARDVSDLLGFYGIKTTVKKVVRSDIEFPNGKTYDKEYTLWYVQVRHHTSVVRFYRLFGLSHVEKQSALARHASRNVTPTYVGKTRVSSVELTDLQEDVWDISVADETHCFQLAHCVTGNCSEIIIRSCGLCNLSEVVVRSDDNIETLKRKVRLATILGTMQASLTNFRYLREVWRTNAEEESLLGVSLTGIMDNELMAGRKGKKELAKTLDSLREYAVEVNQEWAGLLGINPAAAITCVKPSGCATLDTKVRTDRGVLSMAEIFAINGVRAEDFHPSAWIEPTESLYVFDENNDRQLVTKLYVNGMADVYEIEDKDGNTYRFTGNHKLKTDNGWKRVDQLAEADEIVSFDKEGVSSTPKIKSINRLKDNNLTVDIEVANTHSYQLDNGWVSHNTVSQLVNCASGIHPRYARHYIRTIRADKKDPLAKLMFEMGFPVEDDRSKPEHNWVFSFPMKVPEEAIVTTDITSLEHLDLWKTYQMHWCEHKPSITVHLRDHEWMDAGAWVYRNFDIVSGISFLPYSGHTYVQAPYQECSEEDYNELLDRMPKSMDWERLKEFEKNDHTISAKTYACSGSDGACDAADLLK
jgi:hypothetical protein